MPDPSPSASPSRRTLLAGGALVGVGAVVGVGAGLVRHTSTTTAPPHPELLLAAVRAERALLAGLTGPAAGSVPASVLRQLHADHLAHLDALTAAVAVATGAASSAPVTAAPPSHSGRTLAQVRAAETAAAATAAARALQLTGPDAALLASIAACEASHAELLR